MAWPGSALLIPARRATMYSLLESTHCSVHVLNSERKTVDGWNGMQKQDAMTACTKESWSEYIWQSKAYDAKTPAFFASSRRISALCCA